MRLSDLIARCRREMISRGLPPDPDAEIFVAALAKVPRSRLRIDPRSGAEELLLPLAEWIERRASGEPVQYILGAWEFFGREFRLSRETLIPRPETEGLVEKIVAGWKRAGREEGRMLDVGTGSGAIAVTLAAELPRVRLVAVDRLPRALSIARENARRHRVADRVRFLCADADSALKSDVRFDVVVSNPPYVSDSEWESLPREVRDFEPSEALRGGRDGLDLIRRLVREGAGRLFPGGELWLEIGATQGRQVRSLPCGALRFAGIERDLADRDRVARWILPADGP